MEFLSKTETDSEVLEIMIWRIRIHSRWG